MPFSHPIEDGPKAGAQMLTCCMSSVSSKGKCAQQTLTRTVQCPMGREVASTNASCSGGSLNANCLPLKISHSISDTITL